MSQLLTSRARATHLSPRVSHLILLFQSWNSWKWQLPGSFSKFSREQTQRELQKESPGCIRKECFMDIRNKNNMFLTYSSDKMVYSFQLNCFKSDTFFKKSELWVVFFRPSNVTGVAKPAITHLEEPILSISFQLCIQLYQIGNLKLKWWEYLHHRNWQPLQIGFLSPPPAPPPPTNCSQHTIG